MTLDDDVAMRVQDRARSERTSFKQELNAILRKGLGRLDAPTAKDRAFVVRPHRGGFRPGVDPLKLNQVVDQLEVDDFMRKAGA